MFDSTSAVEIEDEDEDEYDLVC